MFEGKPPNPAAAQPLDRRSVRKGGLRPVSWADLVARFDAVRELRTELGIGEAAGEASFDPDSARHIAEIGEGKPDINLDDLADGKTATGRGRPDVNRDASDDPRT
jgi:hypothetical protein